ncbi:CrcB family protein [Rhodohalobacter sp. SW132]|uniref:fluoride efflux transporter FluC n=1 Tax=Rhodohalobacter sp. SW132 TaxID=2293433 RepID=UPI000E25B104|nr:CrcB family protein [Rhodohalobacter sp. SW132]REL38968.1 CrcB family protein [Rhodohalobacter sp. SW132]
MKNLLSSNVLWIALGGVCGALLRHATNTLFGLLAADSHFITATTIENLLGSFLMGVFFTVLSRNPEKNIRINLFLLTGLLGSYTTYSGFMTEAFVFFGDSFYLFAAYLFSQIFAGVLLLAAGVKIAQFIRKEN